MENLYQIAQEFEELPFEALAEKAVRRSHERTFPEEESLEVKIIHAGESSGNLKNLQPIAESPLTVHISHAFSEVIPNQN